MQLVVKLNTIADLLPVSATQPSDELKKTTTGNNNGLKKKSCYCSSCRLQLKHVVIGWCGEEKLLLGRRAVIAGRVSPQCPLKV